MPRISKDDVYASAVTFNRMLANGNSGRQIYVSFRNGYCALDEYEGTMCIRNIFAGSKREVANFISAMSTGLRLMEGRV